MKKNKLLILLWMLILLLTGCRDKRNNSDNPVNITVVSTEAGASEMFTDRDYEVGYDESESTVIELNVDSAACSSDAVQISGSTITITDEGTYVLKGTLNDGMIIVDAEETDKPQLILDGVSINSETSSPIYILEADKVFVTLASDTVNTLTNAGTFTAIDDNNIDAVIFSKQDLTLNGSGSLAITSPAGHGIVSKDDLVFTSGTYTINAASHGLDANNSVRIANATITADSGKDGIHAENTDNTSLGFVYIASGSLNINAKDDGISARSYIQIEDGTINVTESYEGLEALHIDISGGDITLVASDDGLNAAGGNDASGFNGHRGHEKHDKFRGVSSSEGSITISGGKLNISAFGDGIDANGELVISGGHTVVTGPTQGDTATLDYDVSAVITGGTFIGTGASGMAQTFSESEQGVIAVNAGTQSEGTTITLTDSGGNTVLTHVPELSFNVVILSSPDIVTGEEYTLTIGSSSGEFVAY